MKSETVDSAPTSDSLAALRQELVRLSERVAALESAVGVVSRAPGPVQPPAAVKGLSEELILVIGAAIAAFLGKKPHIRQIRLLGSGTWSQQGRVMIQASHDLAVRHG
jgi:methylmalonyl-CoA carboxyltransferase large subunit